MANLMLVLLGLGLVPISAGLLDDAKGPDARLGMAYFTVFILWPWWMGAAGLTAIVWFRDGFVGWHSLWGVRAAMVGIGFLLLVMSFLVRATHMGLPSLLDRMTCIVMPAALVLLLGWMLHPAMQATLPPRLLLVFALVAIGAPVLATTTKAGYVLARASPEIMTEWKARREAARMERQRWEEEANTELRDLRARLASLPADCPIDQLMDLYTGNRPEVFREQVMAAILRRPSIEADLALLLGEANGGYSLAPYMIANLMPKPSAALAPSLNEFMEKVAGTFSHYKGAYPEVFGREVNGLHTILTAARRVRDAGGDMTPGLTAWERELNELPDWPTRASLLSAVGHLQSAKR